MPVPGVGTLMKKRKKLKIYFETNDLTNLVNNQHLQLVYKKQYLYQERHHCLNFTFIYK